MPDNQECPPRTNSYVIQSGDTVYGLARRFDTTVPAIIGANPLIDINNLQVGQRICIPEQKRFPSCPEGNYYQIRPGDTLYSIARRFNISVDDLEEANPRIDPQNLTVGEVICIPLAVPPRDCPTGTALYKIKQGDTFYSIANRFNTTVDELERINPEIDPDALLVGQLICVPETQDRCPPEQVLYRIKQGDTFYSIARNFGITVAELREANPNVNPDRLSVGQFICIPSQ